MKNLLIALAGGLALAGAAHAADLEAGKAAYQKFTCASCHGEDAKSPIQAEYPIIAGQHADYLAHSLKAYRRGQATGGQTGMNVRKNPIMGAMAAQLSDTDIENISAWLASLPGPLAVRR